MEWMDSQTTFICWVRDTLFITYDCTETCTVTRSRDGKQ
jgi:hypothetical protein